VRLRVVVGALALGIAFGSGACGPGNGSASGADRPRSESATQAEPGSRAAGVDSIVLERMPCFGSCPAYRLSVASSGRVHFGSRNPGDSAQTADDSVPPGAVADLLAHAERAGFFQLPERPADDSALCPHRATDHPTVTVAVYAGARTKQVEDYTGCHVSVDPPRVAERLLGLRAFEAAIDSVAGSGRWVRPARRD